MGITISRCAVFVLCLYVTLESPAAERPVAEFDAARGIAGSGWTAANDRPQRAEVAVVGGAVANKVTS